MFSKPGRSILLLGAIAHLSIIAPAITPVEAQRWDDRRSDRANHWDRDGGHRSDWNRRDRERERRNDAKTDGIVAGVVGTAVVAGVIAAIASSSKNKKQDRARDRADECRDRYGNYDPQYDTYRASDGRTYRCEI